MPVKILLYGDGITVARPVSPQYFTYIFFYYLMPLFKVQYYFSTVFHSDKDYPCIFRVHTRPSSRYSSTKTQLTFRHRASSM